jgi:hypothetical protein
METEKETQTAQEIHEILYDGADIPVTYQAGVSSVAAVPSVAGRTEIVKVRKIPRDEFTALALVIGDDSEEGEYREAALYCDRDEAWARSLDEASLDRVLAEGQRLNFSSYARWFRRRVRAVNLVSDQASLVEAAATALTRLQQRENTNGSATRATASATSGPGRTKS